MGVEWKDTFEVGKLLGIKTFLNEFVAYQDLAKLIKNRESDLAGSKISVSTLWNMLDVLCTSWWLLYIRKVFIKGKLYHC